MESFGQNWVVLPNWASWKLGKLLWSGWEGQNFELYCLFFFWKRNWFRLKLSQEFPVMTLKSYKISCKNWIVIFNSLKIYGEFGHDRTLFFPAALLCLSLHKFCSFPFECMTCNALSSPALSSSALQAILMLPVSCFTLPYLFLLTLYQISHVLHSSKVASYNRKKI